MSDEELDTLQTSKLAELAEDVRARLQMLEKSYELVVEHAVVVGSRLNEAKAICGHGEWLPWLARNFELSASTAQRYMLLASESESNRERIDELPLRNVRKGLIAPAPEKPRTQQPQVDPDSHVGRMLGSGSQPPAPPAAAQLPAPAPAAPDWPPPEPSDEQDVTDAEVVEIPSVLTVAEERKFDAIATQLRDAVQLLGESAEPGLNEESVAAALRDASHAARRAAMNLEELATNVEARG